MTDNNKNHFYFVDPGIGEKGEFCPYSSFEDGRDVKMYITPPEGYELSGFKFEPYDSPDDFYEGKVVAQFVKQDSFTEIVRPNLWKYIIAFVALIGIIVGIILFFFNRNNKTESVIEYPVIEAVSIVDDSVKSIVSEEAKGQETAAEPEVVVEQKTVIDEPVKEEIVKEEKVQVPAKEVVKTEKAPLPTAEMTAQFKVEFWTLIHQQVNEMPVYGKLFRTYKEKAEGEEYRYLGWTILRSSKDFEVWNNLLLSIPPERISTVNSIDQLTKLLEEYNN